MNNYMKVILSAVKTYIDKVAARFNNKVNEIDEKIPTKISQLENDKVFVTEEYVINNSGKVKTVNGTSPNEDGNVDVKMPIRPFPIYSKEVITTSWNEYTKYIVNIEDLEHAILYNFQENDYTTESFSCWIAVICDDGTIKEITGTGAKDDLFSIMRQGNNFIYLKNLQWFNELYSIDLKDKTTASSVKVTTMNNVCYLPVDNYSEYTPTANYHPATKKYVDDSVTNIDLSVYETTDNAQAKLEEAKSYADTSIANLVNSAPETLDTLGELAAAFEENHDMVETLNEAIAFKANQSDLDKFKTETWTFTLNDGTTVTKQMVVK